MLNKVFLMGRLTRDPELRTTQNGTPNCRISVAIDRRSSRQGEEKQADFIDVTCWNQTAEFVCKWFTKGRMILVEGSIRNNNYTDKNGNKIYSYSIWADNVQFCGDKSSNGGNGGGYGGGNGGYNGGYNGGGQGGYNGGNGGGYNGGGQSYGVNGGPSNYPDNNSPYGGNSNGPARMSNGGGQGGAQGQGAPSSIELGDLGDFEEILSDGEVPF